MIEFELQAENLSSSQLWALLDWCRSRGASEFAMDMLDSGKQSPFCDRAQLILKSFSASLSVSDW